MKLFFMSLLIIFISSCQESTDSYEIYNDHKESDFESAIENWSTLVEQDSSNPLYLNNYGWSLMKYGNFTKSKKILTKAKDLAQKQNKGRILMSINTNLDELANTKKAIKKYESGKYNEFLKFVEKINLNSDLILIKKAFCLAHTGDYNSAKEDIIDKMVEKYKKFGDENRLYEAAYSFYDKFDKN